MSASARLYTPELLGLAVELAGWPLLGSNALHGEARSPTCGSTIAMDVLPDEGLAIGRLGMRVRACAVGQAAAAIFARHSTGRDLGNLQEVLRQIEAWLSEDGVQPDWSDIGILEAARGYPARHGAILLPWRAAVAALSSPVDAGSPQLSRP